MLALVVAPARAQEGPSVWPLDERGPDGRLVAARLLVGARGLEVEWALPSARTTPSAAGLVVLAPGFTRRCANLRGSMRALMGRGLMVLCVDAGTAGGHPAAAEALAETLRDGPRAPDGSPLPARIVVAGHSAGAAFAARLGAALARSQPGRLAGALLFDPVATAGFGADLGRLSAAGRVPVRALLAAAGPCNAWHDALPALRAVRDAARAAGGDAFVGWQLGPRSTHVDVEGEDGDALAWLACRQGRPQPDVVARLRRLAADAAWRMVWPDTAPSSARQDPPERAARRAAAGDGPGAAPADGPRPIE